MSVVKYGRSIFGLFRAISAPDAFQNPHQISTIGIGVSRDGVHFKDRMPFIMPKEEWDKFGCEDPRVTYFEGNFYVFYTALSKYPPSADSIKVAVAISKDLNKMHARHLVTPFNAKAMTLFPERINGKVTAIFSLHTDEPPSKMVIVEAERIEELWSPAFWEKWIKNVDDHAIDPRRNERDH